MLEIYAGKTALKTIKQQGFSQHLFTSFLGASGGPKWFMLYGFDQYLFGEFFTKANRDAPLNILGSSAGAYRAACFGQNNPLDAYERLTKIYSETVYPKNISACELTNMAREILTYTLGDTGVDELINNRVFKSHFIVSRCKGLAARSSTLLQGAGMAKSYFSNRLSRRQLTSQYQRFVFGRFAGDSEHDLFIDDPWQFPTQYIPFNQENVLDACLASGAIPMVMAGVKNIAGAPKGMYRDGGIIDYHFDFKLKGEGLTLYPHFSTEPKAGWFDKSLSRKVSLDNYDKVVMICPSKEFVASLPFGKIPDRQDFTTMDSGARIKYWHQVLGETERLGEALARFCEGAVDGQGIHCIN